MVGTMDFGRHFGISTWYEGYLGGTDSVPFTGGNSSKRQSLSIAPTARRQGHKAPTPVMT